MLDRDSHNKRMIKRCLVIVNTFLYVCHDFVVKTVHMHECLKHDFSALILSTSFCLCLVTRWTQAKLPTADIRLVFCVSEFYRKMTTLKTSTFGTTANGKEVKP